MLSRIGTCASHSLARIKLHREDRDVNLDNIYISPGINGKDRGIILFTSRLEFKLYNCTKGIRIYATLCSRIINMKKIAAGF